MIGQKLRRKVFFTLDKIKGNDIKKHLLEIQNKDIDVNKKLNNILEYASNRIPFYSNYKEKDFSEFPIINKKDIMQNYNSFLSPDYKKRTLHRVSTSGSTGVPFVAYLDSNKRSRVIADLLNIHEKNEWLLGDKYVFIRAWTSNYKINRMKNFAQNLVPIDTKNFNDNAKSKLTNQLINDKKIKVILAYGSALNDYINFLENNNYNNTNFNIKAIFSGSDNLDPNAKKRLEDFFECPVINRYSNEEQGPMGYTLPYNNEFVMNTTSYRFELVEINSNKHVKPGEIGRKVVTDYHNKAMPFIRYDIGDLGISYDKDMSNIQTLYSLEGRSADTITDSNDNLLSAATINNNVHEFFEIKQYQLIQYDKNEYEFKIVCDKHSYSTDVLINSLEKILGKDAIITINFVDQIPLENTGKYKPVVNKMKETI